MTVTILKMDKKLISAQPLRLHRSIANTQYVSFKFPWHKCQDDAFAETTLRMGKLSGCIALRAADVIGYLEKGLAPQLVSHQDVGIAIRHDVEKRLRKIVEQLVQFRIVGILWSGGATSTQHRPAIGGRRAIGLALSHFGRLLTATPVHTN